MTRIVQIGMCAADLPRAVRRLVEVVGFQDAGGRMTWGPRVAAIQQLGNDTTGALWWLVGGQEFLNVELFHHSDPKQRPLPGDWLPNAMGWVRWGVAVADFNGVTARLEARGTALSEIVTVDGLRRVCCREPDVGVVVEVMEDGESLARPRDADVPGTAPRNVYVTLSVSDLAAARAFYSGVLGMRPRQTELHTPEMEAMWGLPGAQRDVLVLDGESMLVEVVQYLDPPGRPRTDPMLSDQGIMNIAVGYRDRSTLVRELGKAEAAGCTVNAPLGSHEAVATYVTDPLGNSLEMLSMPKHLEGEYGWVGRPPAYR